MNRSIELAIVFLTPLLAFFLIALLKNEGRVYDYFLKNSEEIIGKVQKSEGNIRKRMNNEFVWIPTMVDSDIQNFDTFYAGENSRATLQLLNDITLELNPNTILKISSEGNQLSVSLDKGGINAKSSSGAKMSVSGRHSSSAQQLTLNEESSEINTKSSLAEDRAVAPADNTDTDEDGNPQVRENFEVEKSDYTLFMYGAGVYGLILIGYLISEVKKMKQQ